MSHCCSLCPNTAEANLAGLTGLVLSEAKEPSGRELRLRLSGWSEPTAGAEAVLGQRG